MARAVTFFAMEIARRQPKRAKQRINPRDLREIARVTKQSSLDHEILLVPRSRPERTVAEGGRAAEGDGVV